MHTRLVVRRHTVERLRTKLSDPRFLIAERQQYVDDLGSRLERHVQRSLARRRTQLERLHRRLFSRHPRSLLAAARLELEPLGLRARSALCLRLERARSLLSARVTQLDGLSPLAILARGYAIVTDGAGRVLYDANQTELGQRLVVKLHRGELAASVADLAPVAESERSA
jgi:exodeoxyribonuclease VII large subunit